MGLIFISHSSKNNDRAIAVRDWLRDKGWRETFLDLDPEAGLVPGQRWQEELKKAGENCSAVILLPGVAVRSNRGDDEHAGIDVERGADQIERGDPLLVLGVEEFLSCGF